MDGISDEFRQGAERLAPKPEACPPRSGLTFHSGEDFLKIAERSGPDVPVDGPFQDDERDPGRLSSAHPAIHAVSSVFKSGAFFHRDS